LEQSRSTPRILAKLKLSNVARQGVPLFHNYSTEIPVQPLNKAREFVKRWRRPFFELMGSDRYSHLAINDLDRKLKKYLDFRGGFFIEAGANDGLMQSNTYWLERFRDWHGLLIEAVPEKARACKRNRPKSTVIQSALVGSDDIGSIQINAAELMAFVTGSFDGEQEEKEHLANAIAVQNLAKVEKIDVPARTLSGILDEQKSPPIDLISLDVEGFEIEVLKGLDFRRHRPVYILLETRKIDAALGVLEGSYVLLERFSHHDYLLRAKP
jgi:FkbM family methyltransferase